MGELVGFAAENGTGIFTSKHGCRYTGPIDTSRKCPQAVGMVTLADGGTLSCQYVGGREEGYSLHRYASGDIRYDEYGGGTFLHWAEESPYGRTAIDGEPCNRHHAEFQRIKTSGLVAEVRPRTHTLPRPRASVTQCHFFAPTANGEGGLH